MERTTSTSSAELIDLDIVQEQAEKAALKEAGRRELPVNEVSELERQNFYAILTGQAKGTDGASADGSLDKKSIEAMPDEMKAEVDKRVKEDDEERKEATAATPDAHVFERKDALAGYQIDGTKEVGLADDVILERDKRVPIHEGQHVRQKDGDGQIAALDSGVQELDEGLTRGDLREDDAVTAEGGLYGHTAKYVEHVRKARAAEQLLDESGLNGKQMVKEAAMTREGFEKLNAAMVSAATKKRIKDNMALAA